MRRSQSAPFLCGFENRIKLILATVAKSLQNVCAVTEGEIWAGMSMRLNGSRAEGLNTASHCHSAKVAVARFSRSASASLWRSGAFYIISVPRRCADAHLDFRTSPERPFANPSEPFGAQPWNRRFWGQMLPFNAVGGTATRAEYLVDFMHETVRILII
jgi:hypothetical protein